MVETAETGRSGHPTGDWKDAFLDALSKTANVSRACKAAKISRSAVYARADRDPEFQAEWAEAEQTAVDALEGEAWRRALKGTRRPVFYRGDVVGHIREYSDPLILALLRAFRPERYGNAAEIKRAVEEALAEIAAGNAGETTD